MTNAQQITQETQDTRWGITARGRMALALDRQAQREHEEQQRVWRESSTRAGPKAFSILKTA